MRPGGMNPERARSITATSSRRSTRVGTTAISASNTARRRRATPHSNGSSSTGTGAVADGTPRSLRAGFIGLGVMGSPMARHLLDAGYAVTVHSRSRGPVDELVAAGAMDGRSAAGVGQNTDVVILMLPDPPDVHEVIFDEGLADA